MFSCRFTRGAKFALSSSRARILQVIERAAIGNARNQRAKLQRRHLNSLAKAGHAGHSAKGRRLGRKSSGMLFRNLVTGEFAETQQAAVMRNRVKTHAAAKLFEERVIRVSQRFG